MFISHHRVGVFRKALITVSAGLIFCLLGCSGSMKVVKPDEKTGYFPTPKRVEKNEIYVKEPVDIKKYQKLFVILPLKYIDPLKRKNAIPLEFDDFFKKSVANIMYFDSVKDKEEMERYLKDKGVECKPDFKGLQNELGDFLVAQVSIGRLDAFNYSMVLVITDPAADKPVLKILKTDFNKSGLDEPLFYPVLNTLIDWIHENKGS